MKRAKNVKLAFDKKLVLAQDPTKSAAQERLMEAAAHTKGGYGGVPQAVGKEFVGDSSKRGAGICLLAKDTGRVLFLKRSPSSNHPEEWDLPGGGADDGETPEATARRETREEIGVNVTGKLEQMSDTNSEDVNYITYWSECRTEFTPKLDKSEHTEFKWAFPNDPPQPLHPGVKITLDSELAKDANPLSIAAVRLGHKGGLSASPAKVAAARINGARHGNDAALAFDKASGRSYDADGRLKVDRSSISRAMVCDYLGSEIPESEALGLDPNKIYKMFRDPDELAKSADTFNNIQLLSEHVPVSTKNIQKELIIGCTGTDTVFEFPFLKNSLCVWTAEGIKRVENKDAQEISCSYRYDADMTPGVFEGAEYHGVMRNIHGNHVILTPAGRCGPTVVVGDSALVAPLVVSTLTFNMENQMSTLSKKALRVKGVLQAVLKPQFAADTMPNLDVILANVNKKNYATQKPLIAAAIKSHMANDASKLVLDNVLDSQDDTADDADPVEGILSHCRGKLSDDEMTELESKVRAMSPKKAEDADEEDEEDKPKEKKAEDEEDKEEKVSKTAMDAAIKSATQLAAKTAEDRTIARINGIHEARKITSPLVGEIAIACDSAEDVYRAALKILGVKTDGIHPSALRTIIELHPNPNTKRTPAFAADSALIDGMEQFKANLGFTL